ncbi:MAG: SDR family oxidoreductase [Acidimicrobiales bacterium]
MDLGLAGRTALVTASSKGLGRGAALALAAEGVNVVLCARSEDVLARAAADATRAAAGTGAGIHSVVVDVTDPAAPARLVAETVERFGGLQILVANAGGPPRAGALEIDDQAILDAVNNNLLTTVRLVREAIPHMRSEGWGRIVAIASNSVKQPIPTLALSNTARTGLWAWAKTASQDLFADGITLNLACPGLHATDRILGLGVPEGTPLGDPEDFGRVVAFLCSQSAAFITGSALAVDGGGVLGLL